MNEQVPVTASAMSNKIFEEALKRLEESKTVKPVFLGAVLLIAGFIRDTNFISMINERLGKNEKLCKVNVGEALAVLLLMLAAGKYNSMSNCALSAKEMPLVSLLDLDPSIKLTDFSRQVMSRALAILASDGVKFFQDFASTVYKKYGLADVIEVHVDSSSMYFYKVDGDGKTKVEMSSDEVSKLQSELPIEQFNAAIAASRSSLEQEYKKLNELGIDSTFLTDEPSQQIDSTNEEQGEGKRKIIRVLRGSSKDHLPELGQIVICTVVDGAYGIPLFTKVADENSNDSSLFAEVAKESLSVLKNNFNSLKYWVCDSAVCTKESFDATSERDVSIVTRAPDKLLFTKDIKNQVKENPEMLQDFLDEASKWQYSKQEGADASYPKACLLKGELHGHNVIAMVVNNPGLSKAKTKTEHKKALSECEKATKALNKKFKCQADAEKKVKEIIAKLKYCEVTLEGYEGREVNAKAGAKTKDPSKIETKLVDVRVKATVTVSQSKLDAIIANECSYVLVTTDTERDWSMLDLYKLYKRNQHIETLWRMQKNHCQLLNPFFLQNNERIEGLAILLSIGALAHTVMQSVVRDCIAKGELSLPDDEGKKYDDNPTIARICRYFNRVNVSVTYKLGKELEIEICNIDVFVLAVLACLGESWMVLIRPETYNSESDKELLIN